MDPYAQLLVMRQNSTARLRLDLLGYNHNPEENGVHGIGIKEIRIDYASDFDALHIEQSTVKRIYLIL